MSSNPIHHEVAAWMARIAAALNEIGDCKTDYGEYYVADIDIVFQGESAGWKILADEHGGFGLDIDEPARIARATPED